MAGSWLNVAKNRCAIADVLWLRPHHRSKPLSMTIRYVACPPKPGSVAPSFLFSETHPEGRIGYREWARRNSRLGDIHSADDRYDHDVDKLMA
jgi:hypothetical protein